MRCLLDESDLASDIGSFGKLVDACYRTCPSGYPLLVDSVAFAGVYLVRADTGGVRPGSSWTLP